MAILISTFLLTTLVIYQLIQFVTRDKRRLQERLKLVGDRQPRSTRTRRALPHPQLGKLIERVSVPGTVMGRQYLDKIQANLTKAGLPLKAKELVLLMIAGAAVGLALGFILYSSLLVAFGLAILGFFVPHIWVTIVKKRRLLRLENQLLDVIVLLSNSMRAGHSFMQAMELVSRETPPPLSTEFARVVKETRLGINVEEALINLSKRVDSKDMELVITGVLIQRQVGGNLAEVLDSIAETIDKRIKMKAKIRALTAQGKMSAWIVSLLPFGLGAFIFGKYPEFARILIKEPVGLAMLVGGSVLLIIGILVIRKVVTIDV